MKTDKRQGWLMGSLCACSITAALGATGCQVSVGGQTLPSPYYLKDDVQYFAPGNEFKLSQEAAAQRAFQADQELQNP